jgi:hypothetical protein
LGGYWPDRWSSFIDTFRVWLIPLKELQNFAQVATVLLLAFLVWKNLRAGNKTNSYITLATLIIFGFWLVTSPFQGNIWSHYYRTLLPLVVLAVTYGLVTYLPKKFYIPILAIVIGSNVWVNIRSGIEYLQSTPTTDEIHWKFYRQMATDIFANSDDQAFGYYVFTPDQFGYQAKYAMRYFAQKENVATMPYSKQPLTYLIMAAYWDDNKFLSKEYWKESQVKITREPDYVWGYSVSGAESYTVMRFDLSADEATIAAEPTLLDGIHFR